MLNIGRLAPGGADYYLGTVASGVEDYYTGSGEAPGYWLGESSATLGLSGEVDAAVLHTVLAGADPTTGEPLTARPRTRPGFDLTFRAPKSVSLLYGLGDQATSMAVRDAHDAAVTAALGYLQRSAAFSRRGAGGTERVAADGFVAAGFRHRSSRAGDPLLHTHVLVANLARAVDDGRWRTLDATALYTHAKTAGYLYQAALRDELTRRLGVEWTPVRNGCADLAGVPERVIEAFSQRRAQIVALLAERGESSAAAAQAATLATRRAKDHSVDPTTLVERWAAQASELGFGRPQVAALLHRTTPQPPSRHQVDQAAEQLAGPTGLTARASTFTRRDVVQAWCQQLSAGASVTQLEGLADGLLADDAGATVRLLDQPAADRSSVIRRSDGRIVAVGAEPRYSTPELLALEQQVIASATGRNGARVAIADDRAVEAAVARRPSLAGEQAAMVRRLTTSGAGVEVVVGKAGAGKTYALDAARDAWQSSGTRVVGCALAAQARDELHAGAGIPSWTIDALLAHLDRPHTDGLASNSVLVVDEAGMVGTRKLARILDHAEHAAAKVVLVGDHHQLPEIDAGGVFRGLHHRLDPIELLDNRRQTHHWERTALDDLRDGDPTTALAAYQQQGRIVVADTAEATRERLVSDWWAARQDHGADAGVMLAARVSDVDDLNTRARTRLATDGQLRGQVLEAAGRQFQAGDEIVCCHNDRRLGVINGSRGHVTAVDAEQRTLAMTLTEGRQVRLDGEYLAAGHLRHGYAITAHKAQGRTTGHTWVLGSDAMYREWGYVALSRGRHSNHLYLVRGASDTTDEAHTHTRVGTERETLDAAARALRRGRSQHLASDLGHADQPPAGSDQTGAVATLPSSGQQRIAALLAQKQAASQALAELRGEEDAAVSASPPRTLRRLMPRSRAKASDTTGARRRSDAEAWQQAITRLDREIEHLQAARSRPAATVHHQAVRAVEAAEFDPPDYLLTTVGQRPHDVAGRRAWRTAALHIERYRAAHGIHDQQQPLGPTPTDPIQRRAFEQASTAVDAARLSLRPSITSPVTARDGGIARG